MRLDVSHIDDVGVRVPVSSADAWAIAAANDALEGTQTEIEGHLHLRHEHGHLFVTGTIQASSSRACERCAEVTPIRVQTDVDLSYVPSNREANEVVENELKSDELNVGWYYDGWINVSDTLREVIALALPPRVVCEDEPSCDARTRALLDGGSVSQGHSGFAALKNWTDT